MRRCLVLLVALGCGTRSAADDLGLAAPPGFEISLFAGDELAHDIYSMTVDARGRVVVAGAGYVKTLEDADGDGRADRATLYSSRPSSGAHGLLFDGPDLICSGDNAVMKLRDADGDGRADGQPEIWSHLRHPEHGANGLVRGPDGAIYLICGNDAGVGSAQAGAAGSPVREPRCGAVVRFSPDGRPDGVLAHGFRNAYDLDFNAAGQMFTVDSDGERDHHLPWYAPNRLFDVAVGMEHGWLLQGWTRSWNRPQSFGDNVERLVEIGRGSPTGVVTYRHRQFPQHFRGGLFTACWTLGRVYFFPLERAGSTYRSKLEVFLQTTGTTGFAPCDMAVGPAGDLFVAIGGRHTRGSVFRVRYRSGQVAPAPSEPLRQVLEADQPLASWSRQRWEPLARRLGAQALLEAARDETRAVDQRVRAIEVLVDLFDGVSAPAAEELAASKSAEVRARLAWALERRATTHSAALLAQLAADDDPRVVRAAWEAIQQLSALDSDVPLDWRALACADRRARFAAICAARGSAAAAYRRQPSGRAARRSELADLWVRREPIGSGALGDPRDQLCLATVRSNEPPAVRLEAVRLWQIRLGDLHIQPGRAEVFSGYLGNGTLSLAEPFRRSLAAELAPAFPSDDAELNRELARLLGMLGTDQPGLLDRLARQWTSGSPPTDDIHYLIVASLLPGRRSTEFTRASAAALLRLAHKMDQRGQQASRNWPDRVAEMFDELRARDERLADALVGSAAFTHAQHVLFAARLPDTRRAAAVRKLLAAGDEAVTPQLVELCAILPEDEQEPVRRFADQPHLADAAVRVLAQRPREEDRARLVAGLASVDAQVVQSAAKALATLAAPARPEEIAAALAALRRACLAEPQRSVRTSLAALLSHWTGQSPAIDESKAKDLQAAYAPWFAWFAQRYPRHAERLGAASGGDARAWRARLAKIDWQAGDAVRGRKAFELRSCHRCHQASGHLGPELKGAAARMSRDDLLLAIIDPNQQVSPTYQTTLVTTGSGQVYHGLVVYESPEGVLLQTGPDTTLRIADEQRITLAPSKQSLMPTGLLDQSSDGEIADLLAYLRTLAK